MKSRTLDPFRAALIASLFVFAPGCVKIPGVNLPGGFGTGSNKSAAENDSANAQQGSSTAKAADPNDPCSLPPAKRTNQQHAWCQEQDRLRRQKQYADAEQAKVDAQENQREGIVSRAIVTHFEGLTKEDAVDPRKVEEVLGKITAEHLVHLRPGAAAVYAPGMYDSNGRQCQEPSQVGRTEALTLFGATLMHDFTHTSDAHRRPRTTPAITCNDAKAQRDLGPSDPAILWAPLDGDRALLVGLDGGRYVGWIESLIPGAPEASQWPATAPNTVLYPDDVDNAAKQGKFPKERLKAVQAARKKYEECYAKVAPKFKKQLDTIAARGGTWSHRDSQMRPVGVAWDKATREKCGKLYQAFVQPVQKFMQEERARREKLYQETTARLKK